MRRLRRPTRAATILLVLGAAACEERKASAPASPRGTERAHDLAQGILAWAQQQADAAPDVRADVSLALAEVATRDHAARLRLIAADDDNPFHDAAGHALARLRAARATDALAELDACAKAETLDPVKLGCLRELRHAAPDAFARLVSPWFADPATAPLAVAAVTAGHPQPGPWRNTLIDALEQLPDARRTAPEVVVARDALLAPTPLLAPDGPDSVIRQLDAEDLEARRSAVRALLLVPDTFRADERLETALLLATRAGDDRLQHLVEAVFLRRKLLDENAAAKARR